MAIRFGTDGWRGIIAEDFTFANVRACAGGVARYLRRIGQASQGLVVGYDTRFASDAFARHTAEVASALGVPVLLADRPTPTPVTSYAIVARRRAGGVILTASHNPPEWNGFKFRPDYAGSAPPEVLRALEEEIARVLEEGDPPRLPLEMGERKGLVRVEDLTPDYDRQVARLVDLDTLRRAGLRVVVDAMHGAGAGHFPRLLAGGSTRVEELRPERNPAFPGMAQPEPVAHNLGPLLSAVPARNADVGLALDGDADRLGVVDEKGTYLTTQQVFALLAYSLLEVRGLRGPIVKSVTSTMMLFRLAERYKVPVHETPVGFKFVGPRMQETNALLAGEESGGYAVRGHIPERDGILSGLLFLDLLVRTGKRPSELLEDLYRITGPYFYGRRDLPFPPERRPAVEERVASAHPHALGGLRVTGRDALDGTRWLLNGKGWLLIRFSGTEPLLRIYAEADSPERVQRLLDEGQELVGLSEGV